MSDYGIRLKDASSNSFVLTPDTATIISAGRVTLPSGLNGDNTYGTDIDLPSTISVSDLVVITTPVSCVNSVLYSRYIDTTLYYNTFYANSATSYYTRNDSTSVMTSWSAGNKTASSKSTWNPVLSVYPIAFWDKMGATSFSKVRLFGATAHLVRDTTDDTNYSLGEVATGNGINSPTYMNDNDTGTTYGHYASRSQFDAAYSESTVDFYGQIMFASSKDINKVDILWGPNTYGYNANGNFYVQLYYNSAWHTIMTVNFGNNINQYYSNYSYGLWRNCSGIQIICHCYCQKGSGYVTALSLLAFQEIRAWGSSSTDSAENKIVYTIGSGGIPQVDYLIGIKKYNY